MPAVALTDFNNFFAAVKFYKAAQGAGVKPILGADLLLVDESGEGSATQLVLLVRDPAGLCQPDQAYLHGLPTGPATGGSLYPQVLAGWAQRGADSTFRRPLWRDRYGAGTWTAG